MARCDESAMAGVVSGLHLLASDRWIWSEIELWATNLSVRGAFVRFSSFHGSCKYLRLANARSG